ncbi:MAG: hypothetical protein GY705_31740 [Bacteroidetes bacterium]|nr:hypothetical protein [Bacteroidota bacterium]
MKTFLYMLSKGEIISWLIQAIDFFHGRGTKNGVMQRIMRIFVTKDMGKRSALSGKVIISILLTVLFLFSSCYGPEKLLEKEKFDRVLVRAKEVSKYRKKIPLKWVLAAEEAFRLANRKDWSAIYYLEQRKSLQNWKRIYFLAEQIEDRQKRVSSLLPFESETGYVPTFGFSDAISKMEEAQSWIATIYMNEAEGELKNARAGSKKAAMQCIDFVDLALLWRSDIYNANKIRNEAVELAQVRVTVQIEEPIFNQYGSRKLKAHIISRLSEIEHPFLTILVGDAFEFETDYLVSVELLDIDVSGDHISSSSRCYSKEIVTGTKTEKVWNEEDSCYVTKTIEIKKTVQATVTEYRQYKDADLTVLVQIFGTNGISLIDEKRIFASEDFENTFCETEGDDRALDCVSCTGMSWSYPSDWSMIADMCGYSARRFRNFISDYNWWFE